MRGLLNDIFDLLGRLRSLADPSKATPTDEERFASNYAGSKAPAGVDLLDALHAVEAVASVWEAWGRDLHSIQNDLSAVEYFGARVLDRHPEVDGLRQAWSVQDAVDRWGVERRTDDVFVYPAEDDDEIVLGPVREWFDRLLTLEQAAERAGVTRRQVQRWVKDEALPVVARHRAANGSVLKYVYTSAVDAVRQAAQGAQEASRFAAAGKDQGG